LTGRAADIHIVGRLRVGRLVENLTVEIARTRRRGERRQHRQDKEHQAESAKHSLETRPSGVKWESRLMV